MLTRNFWQRWSSEYLTTLQKFSKWHIPSRDLQMNDVVWLRDEPSAPTKWPLARITEIHTGYDGKVRVVTVRTEKGTYKRPVIKIVPLVCQEDGSINWIVVNRWFWPAVCLRLNVEFNLWLDCVLRRWLSSVYIYRMCRVRNSFQFRLDRIDFIGFLGDIIHRIHSSADRQAIVGLLRGRSASNQWILFVGISSRQHQIAQQELSNFALTTLSCQFAAQGLHSRCNLFDFFVAIVFIAVVVIVSIKVNIQLISTRIHVTLYLSRKNRNEAPTVIQQIMAGSARRKQRESFWVHTLQTLAPDGLN